jgi:hypothetical protein
MPRLRRRRKSRRPLDFEKSLATFLADPARMLWNYQSFMGIKGDDGSASIWKRGDKEKMVNAVLRGASNAAELSEGRRLVTVQEFLGEPLGEAG